MLGGVHAGFIFSDCAPFCRSHGEHSSVAPAALQGEEHAPARSRVLAKVWAKRPHRRRAWHGCSVHRVTERLDSGEILGRARLTIAPGDTADSLATRVLELEHRLYPKIAAEEARRLLSLKGSGGGQSSGAHRVRSAQF